MKLPFDFRRQDKGQVRVEPILVPDSDPPMSQIRDEAPITNLRALPPPATRTAKPLALPAPPRRAARHDINSTCRDFRNISPRRFAEAAHELYLEGRLKWPEYQTIGFPSELHPDFNRTIGALIGEKAQPDRPRDMLAEWERRLDFMRRYNDSDVHHAERAVDVLKQETMDVAMAS